MKYLNVIFTYNRPLLLRNCVQSYLEFGPDGDLMIVDDGSSLPEQRSLLDEIASKNKEVKIWIRDRNDTNRLGGLYANMEAVTQQAIEQGYDFVFFIQDDQQFMWRDEAFWSKVQKIYEHHPDTLVVRPVFEKLVFSHVADSRLETCPACPGIRFKKSWFAAVGIVRPTHIAKTGWHFKSTEAANNEYSKSMGLSMVLLKAPVLAFVPVPETWRFGKRTASTKPPVKRYYFKPLSVSQIGELQSGEKAAYLEDYCLPWGWHAWAPYDFSDNRRKYFENLWRWFKKNRLRRWPRWQGVK